MELKGIFTPLNNIFIILNNCGKKYGKNEYHS